MHHDIRVTERDFRDQLGGALRSLDQPTFDAINTYFVSEAVRKAGITVALAGTGGDEIFGGYRSFIDVPKAARIARRLRGVPERVLRAAACGFTRMKLGRFGEVPPQTRWGKLGDMLATRGRLVEAYQVSYGLFTEDVHATMLGGENGSPGYGLPRGRAQELTALISGSSSLHAMSTLELSSYIGERLLRDTDAASMAVSLEVRVPLLDHAVVECAAAIEPDARFHPLGRKMLLRRLAMPKLDPALFDRPKSGFVLPIEGWCRRMLKDEVAAMLADAGLCASVGFDPDAVGRLWRSFEAGAPGMYWSRIWAIYVLLWWCREYQVAL
jgi:asparagine synthase (glutamine-hydrolysing)